MKVMFLSLDRKTTASNVITMYNYPSYEAKISINLSTSNVEAGLVTVCLVGLDPALLERVYCIKCTIFSWQSPGITY